MIINHNLSAIFANRALTVNSEKSDRSMEKLASGLKINGAVDDASGLAVSEKMRAQIRGLNRANQNVQDGMSFAQTAEGYLEGTTEVLQRLRELSVQASNGIYSSEDRTYIQMEVTQLVDEIDRIASQAQFNGMNILTGKFAQPTDGNVAQGSMWIHMGANMDQRERIYIGTMNSQALGLKKLGESAETAPFINLETQQEANITIGRIDIALEKVNSQRADLGAYQVRMRMAGNALLMGYENLQAAESRIRDTNMAKQVSINTTNQILMQSANSMLLQANQRAQLALQLLR